MNYNHLLLNKRSPEHHLLWIQKWKALSPKGFSPTFANFGDFWCWVIGLWIGSPNPKSEATFCCLQSLTMMGWTLFDVNNNFTRVWWLVLIFTLFACLFIWHVDLYMSDLDFLMRAIGWVQGSGLEHEVLAECGPSNRVRNENITLCRIPMRRPKIVPKPLSRRWIFPR